MVGLIGPPSASKLSNLVTWVVFAADNTSKLEFLRQLKDELSKIEEDKVVLLSDLLPDLLKLFEDRFSPVRKCAIEIVGEIGLKHSEFFPQIVPALLVAVDDDTPAVARQAITCGTDIFCCSLEKIAIQGLQRNELKDSLESAWSWMQKLKETICSIAFQNGTDGRRLLALKFVAAIILIYTPDPSSSSEPPPNLTDDGKGEGFSISWLRRGHPVLKVGDLSVEASQSLGLLLDQLRLPIVKSLSTSMVVVLINCLSAIAIKRPSFYGRILPVLLGLDPSSSVVEVLHVYGVQHALKKAFLSCLKCTHPSAIPWRDRLVAALREMKAGELAEQALEGVCGVNGKVKEEKVDSIVVKEEPSIEDHDSVRNKAARKRSIDRESVERNDDEDTPGKRARSGPALSDELNTKPNASHRTAEIKSESSVQATKPEEQDMGPIQQLVGVFAALVAQGEKAAASLDILISSIAADLLADVVMVNLRNFPSSRPLPEGDEELPGVGLRQSEVDTDPSFRQLSSFLMNAISPSSSQQISTVEDVQPPPLDDIEVPNVEESSAMDEDDKDVCTTSNGSTEMAPSDVPFTSTAIGNAVVAPDFQVMGTVDAVIPGLDSAPVDGLPDAITSSSLASTDQEDASQDQLTSFDRGVKSESLPSMSTERSEEHSSKTVAADANCGTTSTATSLEPVQQFVLPKLSAPLIVLPDEEKDKLQKWLFTRILEAYKQVAVAGGSQLRFSLLAYLGAEFPLDLDPWTLLQKHILSDYVNHEGHELTLRVLYRLYGEAEERDLFSSAKAASAYETFLLKVAETLRDSFPASDKSLSRLLGEVPHLPESILKLLECLCCPETGDKDEKELHSGDRVTQGLSAVWSLIMLRPSLRSALLKIALQSAVHHLEEVRMKAIRLVANKLYPLSSITSQIEEFAKDKLLSVVERHIADPDEADKSNDQLQKNPDTVLASNDQATGETISKDPSAHANESSTPGTLSTALVSEAQRCMSLYFALCTKKHALLHQVFISYKNAPEFVKQAVHRHIPILIRTMGASPALLDIISDPPDGSENLLMQVLQTLTDGIVPSAELISTIKKLYQTKMKDIEILFPILSHLPKEEVLSMFPNIVNLSKDKFQAALSRLLQGTTPSAPVLSPSEVLIAIHGIDPDKEGIPLKKVTDACNACFEQKQIFTQQVIAKVLNQLVEQIPLPLLFMRTVLQAIGAFPALADFIMEILSRLVQKQIWKYPKLWVGFLKCAQLTQPRSFSVLLQLPAAQLEGALNKIPALRAPLAAHANQSPAKSTFPRAVLVILGLASDSQAGSQSQAVSQPQGRSQSQGGSQVQNGSQSQGGSQVQTGSQSQGGSQVQTGSQSQGGGESQAGSQVQGGSQSQAGGQSQDGNQSQAGSQSESVQPEVGEASSSDKDTVTEKSKESPSAS